MASAMKAPSQRQGSGLNSVLIRSTIVAALGGLLFGFDTAVIAGATGALTDLFHLTPGSLGLTVAVALWGTITGALFAGVPSDRFGRRDSLRGLAVLFFFSALGCAVAWNWTSFVAFRFVAGLAIGGSSVIGPMYIAEIAPAKWRGRLVGFFQFNVVFGIMLAYLSNYLIGTLNMGSAEWRWKLGVSAAPAALFFLMLFGIPRSPRWLVKTGRADEASAVLTAVGDPDVELEIAKISDSIHLELAAGRHRLFSRMYRKPVMLAILIGMFNQLAGINSILYYLNDIFARAGFTKVSGDLQAVVIGATNLLFTMIAMTVIDKLGRKAMLLAGSVGTAICLAIVCYIFRTGQHERLLIWPLIGYIAFFAFSQGACIWVYISEVFPNAVRAKGQSLGSFTHWFMTALLSWIFPLLSAHSAAVPFGFFSSMMVLQFFVVLFIFPETKGISLEDMQKKLGIGQG
ncbi:MAG TPA: sugar porter family MFS transporter [Acidobacteriaceae bacterium]|nr:sugar porter family MFS transporter [Acidobacteriaceae bacterium]